MIVKKITITNERGKIIMNEVLEENELPCLSDFDEIFSNNDTEGWIKSLHYDILRNLLEENRIDYSVLFIDTEI